MEHFDSSPTKFSAAVQITRPKSAPKQGSSSSLANSPNNHTKVARLVLKPASQSLSNINKPSSPEKRRTIKTSFSYSTLTQYGERLIQNNKADDELHHQQTVKKYQQTVELEMKTRKVEKEKKTLSQQAHASGAENSAHKSNAMDEAARSKAREFMKKQQEKRKLETKKEVDKSFVIKQRLDELRKTTRNVITKKPKKTKPQVKISPPKEFYSLDNLHMKEIRVLRLKPLSAGSRKSAENNPGTPVKPNEEKIDDTFDASKLSFALHSPAKIVSPVKIASPVKKPVSPLKKLSSPLKLTNKQQLAKPDIPQRSRPSSAKENVKPVEDFKLKVPDVKLSLSALNRTEIATQSYHPFMQQQKVPLWLQNTAIQPYPYNFIWAVRKKLEAYTSREEAKKPQVVKDLVTPHLKLSKQFKKGRKLPEFLVKSSGDDNEELQHPTITDDSESNLKSLEREMAFEANTISEISSIKTDFALKSRSQEKESNHAADDDDTTISESIFHSVRDDVFVGKKRESTNSEYSRSFDSKIGSLAPENVSPNTTEMRLNFLSSTILPTLPKPEAQQVDFENNKLNQEKEEDYQKMLEAFNKSLSHVIEVNQVLSNALSSKSSVTSSRTSETVKNYSSSFEKNVESETQKTSAESNISEMIETLVQQSQPPVRVVEAHSESHSSINTFIEDSKSTTVKPDVVGDAIEDPPIIYNEPAQEFSSSSTKVTTTTTTKIVQQKISVGKKEENENSLNESKLLDMFKPSEPETSFSIADNNASFGMLMEKSSSEIKSWERKLIERTRGQVAWLELQKINFRKHGQQDKVSTIKKQQRAILLRLEKERTNLKENSERSSSKSQQVLDSSVALLDMSADMTGNESEARENIERILNEREQKLVKRRVQVEHLINWQRKLDKEEEKLKQLEKNLLGANMKKVSTPKKKKSAEDVLNTSIEKVKSIDKSLKILKNVETSHDAETVEVSGAKLNKLWLRLTGVEENLYKPTEIYHLSKENFAQFYEEAKEVVLQNDLAMLLDSTMIPRADKQEAEKPSEERKISEKRDDSDVSTMNSIDNIETEEEFPGSLPYEPETETATTTKTVTENDDDLKQIMASQMKVFLDHKTSESDSVVPTVQDVSPQIKTPTIDNATFQVKSVPSELDESTSTVGAMEMELELDSLIQTEPLLSIDNSSVDAEGFIIPEINEVQITDMDDDDAQLIEDTSFPNLEITLSDESALHLNDTARKDLSTITECTEYEQSHGSSDDEISSEIVSHASTATTSERVSSEIEKRLVSINESMEGVNEAFNRITIVNRSPSTVTYSTDKDFVDSPKASSESTVKTQSRNLLSFSPIGSEPSKGSGSDMTTSTPKIPMPDIISEVTESKTNESEDF